MGQDKEQDSCSTMCDATDVFDYFNVHLTSGGDFINERWFGNLNFKSYHYYSFQQVFECSKCFVV